MKQLYHGLLPLPHSLPCQPPLHLLLHLLADLQMKRNYQSHLMTRWMSMMQHLPAETGRMCTHSAIDSGSRAAAQWRTTRFAITFIVVNDSIASGMCTCPPSSPDDSQLIFTKKTECAGIPHISSAPSSHKRQRTTMPNMDTLAVNSIIECNVGPLNGVAPKGGG